MFEELIELYRIFRNPPRRLEENNSIEAIQNRMLVEEKRKQFVEAAKNCANSIRARRERGNGGDDEIGR